MSALNSISHHLFVSAAGHEPHDLRRTYVSKPETPQRQKEPVVMDLELLQADTKSRPARPLQAWIRPPDA